MVVLSAVIVIVMLAILITVHEFGHFIAARLCGIKVREFAIGMGPVIWKKDPAPRATVTATGELIASAEEGGALPTTGTRFSIRAVPFGGFCDMGEDEESSDPNHFRNKKLWQKIIVLVAGSFMNLVIGVVFIVILALLSIGTWQTDSVISSLSEGFSYSDIQVGDRIVKVNSHKIYGEDISMFLSIEKDKPYTLVLERDGKTFEVNGVERKLTDKSGNPVFGISFARFEMQTGDIPYYVLTKSINYVRYVWVSLGEMISGRASLKDMMGPVGIVNVVNDVITTETEGVTSGVKFAAIMDFVAMIAINLAVVNMLPIPALDGGRILFLFISAFLLLVRKRPLSEKVEGYIHGITYFLLIGLMVLVLFGDIRRWIGF